MRKSPGRRRIIPLLIVPIVAAIVCLSVNPALATVTYTVTFEDPLKFAEFHDPIVSNVLAAGARWSQFLLGDATIDLLIRFGQIPTATGNSITSGFVRNNGTFNVFDQGAAAEVRTGVDPNGADPDGLINIGTNYLVNELAFDPHPTLRSDPIPTGRTDALSIFLHEIGHVLAINGFRDEFDGSLPGDFESTFDEQTIFDGTDFFFTGPRATALYGKPVPLTFGNYRHLGNEPPRLGSDLIPDLMNGVVLFRETRYDISALDVEILCDVGVPGQMCQGPVIPEPSTWLLLGSGLVGLAMMSVRRRDGNENSSLRKFDEG
jgi:hypothetical protein